MGTSHVPSLGSSFCSRKSERDTEVMLVKEVPVRFNSINVEPTLMKHSVVEPVFSGSLRES